MEFQLERTKNSRALRITYSWQQSKPKTGAKKAYPGCISPTSYGVEPRGTDSECWDLPVTQLSAGLSKRPDSHCRVEDPVPILQETDPEMGSLSQACVGRPQKPRTKSRSVKMSPQTTVVHILSKTETQNHRVHGRVRSNQHRQRLSSGTESTPPTPENNRLSIQGPCTEALAISQRREFTMDRTVGYGNEHPE